MPGLQYAILKSIQLKPRSVDDIVRCVNRLRIIRKKIPRFLIVHTIDDLETAGLLEEMSQAEIDEISSGGDPDEIDVVASDEFVGWYFITGSAAFDLVADEKGYLWRSWSALIISALSLALSFFSVA